MSTPFNPHRGLIVVPTRICGPKGAWVARLALDTGAGCTLVRAGILTAIGCDPALATQHTQMTTASGIAHVPRVAVDRIEALEQHRAGLLVAAHTLPASALVDGVLGLDFLRGQTLTVDFRAGEITLA